MAMAASAQVFRLMIWVGCLASEYLVCNGLLARWLRMVEMDLFYSAPGGCLSRHHESVSRLAVPLGPRLRLGIPRRCPESRRAAKPAGAFTCCGATCVYSSMCRV
ncbi:hypothetical protein N658DRAFT_281718 [Parathielavia hyrcaniae]|uniref:Uncharacterized protein n=1 Tax=Parathielavia hyrcaniae TaxID=113614 RepID=A0AAN6T4C6_9PEZI|nr:hypothetical protein N658DRAFT_281718 [Parathielavia hyrcaniae]